MALDSEPPKDDRISRIQSSIRVIPNFPKPGVMFQDITTMLLDPKAFKDTVDLFVERYKGKDISVVAGVEARGFIFGPPIALAIGAKFVPMRKPGKLPGTLQKTWTVSEFLHRNCGNEFCLGLSSPQLHSPTLNIPFYWFWKLSLMNGFRDVCNVARIRQMAVVSRTGYILGTGTAGKRPQGVPFESGDVISEEYSLEYGTDKIEMHVGAVEAGERAIIIDDLIATGGTLSAALKLLERVGVQVVECACLIELPELKGRERLGDNPLFVLIKSA
uniref:adenine phosphoribosyltransferase n=1 Tax=Chenopodium quinoa TaxID=63459 RepID=A0A803MYT2_CHEQI